MNSEIIIDARELVFRYDSEEPNVLNGVDIKIKKGQFVALLGHNGSGKSTFAKHLNAILLPSGGKVYVAGLDSSNEETLTLLRSTVGMVLQNPDNQMVAAIVEEDVAFGPENLGIKNPELRKRVDDALKAVGMYDYRRHAPHKLSGGQKQRVAIAGILAMQPECIVLDEPTAMLDPGGREEVMDAICRLCRENGVTIVLITHHMDEALLADRVIIMDKGSVLLDAPPSEAFADSRLLREHGLDLPQAVELAEKLRAEGFDIAKETMTAEAAAKEIKRLLESR